jgi:hypothetical protein
MVQFDPSTNLPTVGALCLAENSGPYPRQLYMADGDNIGVLTSNNRGPASAGVVISKTPVPFNSLLVASVPRGAVFDLEVA